MPDSNYRLDFTRHNQHLVDVTLTFTAGEDQPKVWMPSWLPGSYLIREFARNITSLHYQPNSDMDGMNEKYRADKVSKNEWQLTQVQAGDKVLVTYEVYCYDLSVRTAYVDQNRLYGNFSALLVAISGQEKQPIGVTLQVLNDFYEQKDMNKIQFVSGLPHFDTQGMNSHEISLHAESYDELIDYPFELSEQDEFHFEITNKEQKIPHRFFISGRHTTNFERLQADVNQICQHYVDWLGDAPFDNYTFMTFASGNDYGGLEHINSTSLVTPRDDLPTSSEKQEPNDNYQRFLGLVSHEYFHAWWVKTVRPDVMMDVDLRTEAYTPLLWVFEGFTSYIDDFMLQACEVINKTSYLKLLAGQINRYNQCEGRELQAVAESSFDAWIKLYRPDENSTNAGISYYNKGALVALCLDLVMLERTQGKYRLFDVVRAFYGRAKQQHNQRFGMNNENLSEIICQFIDPSIWQDFYDKYVIGIDNLPIDELLIANGITVNADEKDNLQPWGMVVNESPMGLTVNKVNRFSVASEAGLSAKDVIVAIDGIKASKKQLAKVATAQALSDDSVVCYAFRRDELMTFTIPAQTQYGDTANPSLGKVVLTIEDVEIADKWLDGLK